MKISLSIIISFFMFFASNAQNVTYIDLTQAKFAEVNAEKIFEKIKFVPLETNQDALLKMKSS